ncbi:MAG: hypothetical protein N3G20_08520, partial [Verrucomicrobiae bacterium]|nr:hypothetical protein [Verrucomicrobiae bacterium]
EETPALSPQASSAIDAGLGQLGAIANALENLEAYGENLPLIGASVGGLVDPQVAIMQTIQARLSALLGSLPRVSQVTSAIESWDGTTYAGFTTSVKGVLAHYGSSSSEPVWWDVSLELVPSPVTRALQNLSGSLFDAAFTGTPTVSVKGGVVLDIAFGYEIGPGFFLAIDAVGLSARVNATGLDGFGFGFNTPAGTQNLGVTGGSIDLKAAVLATPDDSILTGGRITQATLSTLSAANIGNAFNLQKIGSLYASLPLTGSLSFPGFALAGTYVVRVQSDDLFTRTPQLSIEVDSTLTVMGQTLAGRFVLKNTGTQTVLEARDVVFQLGAGATRVLKVQNGSGTFVLLDNGLAGRLEADFELGPAIPNITVNAGGLSLLLNTSPGAVPEVAGSSVNLPAGPYYRVCGHGTVGLSNPEALLEADFVFEPRDADSNLGNGYEEVAASVAHLNFGFGDGSSRILGVTDGAGAFVFRSDGIVGVASASLVLAVPAVGMSGSFSVSVNNTAAPYNQTVTVNGSTLMVDVDVGPFLRIGGAGVTLTVQGMD